MCRLLLRNAMQSVVMRLHAICLCDFHTVGMLRK